MWRRAAACAALTCGVVLAATTTGLAVSSRAGDVRILEANSHLPVSSLRSTDQFWLQPTGDPACPGDSMHDQWRIQGFLIPESVDPAGVHYGAESPKVPGGFGLWDWRGNNFAQILLKANSVANQPGYLNSIDMLSMKFYPAGTVAPGRYRLGVACTLWRDTHRYWDVGITVSAPAADGTFRWTVDGVAATTSSDSGSVPLVAVASAVVVALIAGLLWRRRHRGAVRTQEGS